MTGPYIKPTVFSGNWVNLRYDQTPINYFSVLSGTASSVADASIIYSASGTQINPYNSQSYSFNRKRLFLENSEGLLPGPLNESRLSELGSSRFAASSEDIMYNSTFYELKSSSSVIKVEVAKRVPHIFSIQFSSINNTRYIPLIIRPFGCSFGFNAKIFENINYPNGDSSKDINAVTGVHFHNPTYDSYASAKIPYLLPEDREIGLGLPMFSKVYMSSPSSMVFYGALRPFDFISASGEAPGTYYSEKGTGSFANPVFWQGIIMAKDFNFNWFGIEGVHKIKQYYYNPIDLLGVSSGQHLIQYGIDLYFTNTFNNGYLYRPDYVPGSDPVGLPSALYDLNKYVYRPSVTGTSLFGNVNDINYSGLFASGNVFQVQYVSNSAVENPAGPYYVVDQRQGLWHNVYHYSFNGGDIFTDQGKNVVASSHPYFSSVFAADPAAFAASGLWDGWNADPAYPFTSSPNYGPKSGRGKPYVCPIFELSAGNPFGTTDKVCIGIYTKLTPNPSIEENRPNFIAIGQRREQLYSVWNKNQYYRPMTLETTSSPYGTIGPYTIEDINAGGYLNIYATSNKEFKKGWKALEYWLVIAETKEQVISKIDLLHSMGVAESGPMAPELELPKAVYDSVLAYPVKGTL